MKAVKLIGTLLAASSLLMVQNIYAGTVSEADSDILAKIHTKLDADPVTKNLKVAITSHDGLVEIIGKVKSDSQALQLAEDSASVKGVTDVDTSQLKITGTKHSIDDAMITAKVKGTFIREKLFGDKEVAAWTIHVKTKDGVVYLTGKAADQTEIDNAIKLAKSIKDVKDVNSKVEVKKM